MNRTAVRADPPPPAPSHLTFHASVAAGLEPAAAEELRRLGLDVREEGRGLVRFTADPAGGARAALALRSAPRVVLELARDLPGEAEPLRDALGELPWEDLLPARASWAARAVGTTPALRHTGFTARLVKDAVSDRCARLRRPFPPVDLAAPDILVEVRLDRGQAAVGLDLGGRSLHARGTGRHGEAPLREDVAAGLALLAGVCADVPLLDPFCGTGTLIAEAAAVALGIAPGRDPARLPLARLPQFAGIDLRALAHDLDRPPCAPHAPFLAFDAEPRAVAQARAVIARLGLAGDVTVARGHVPEVPLPALAPGLLVSNPPWGLRLDAESAQQAWRGLGTLARERLAGWRLALLSGQPGVTRHLGFKAERRWPVRVGGVDARWLIYTVRG